ncbi:MAG TPA: PQQ-binding-like beta-propeller repeat protein [Solirubrobacterales bacterium]|nr:PQQ-binding-like beta-propeller repeat protein [Solirubrobacterales bacterium]
MMELRGGRGRVSAAAALAVALVAAALPIAGCGGGSSSADAKASLTGSGYSNVDLANTRDAKGSIKSANAGELQTAWTAPIPGESSFGSYASTPVVSKGVVYSQDLASNVQALEESSGEVLWTKSFELPNFGPNGLAVQEGKVFGATPGAVFALDEKTGKQLWSTTLVRNDVEGINMAPGFDNDIVYASTVPTNTESIYEPGGVGILWALDAKTGKKLWHFDTVPKSLWGHPDVNSGGGLWYPPTFDGKGSMYVGVGNPAPFPGSEGKPWGSSRPGPNLYTDSLVKLDAKTGKLDWYYQFTPHDLYDWDLQDPPILVHSGGRELLLAAGKVGFVVAVDAKSGKPVWKSSVGRHNGHDEDGLIAMRGETSKLHPPFEIYPGTLGGVIAPMSTDGTRVFVPVVNHPVTVASGEQIEETSPVDSGEIVALNVKDGSLAWKHEFPNAPAFGATTVSNDLVFATTYDGKVYGYDTKTGRQVWQEQLPAGTNAGVTVDGETLIAPAGVAAEGQTPALVAFRLGG